MFSASSLLAKRDMSYCWFIQSSNHLLASFGILHGKQCRNEGFPVVCDLNKPFRSLIIVVVDVFVGKKHYTDLVLQALCPLESSRASWALTVVERLRSGTTQWSTVAAFQTVLRPWSDFLDLWKRRASPKCLRRKKCQVDRVLPSSLAHRSWTVSGRG